MLPAITALPTFNAAPVLAPSPLGLSAVPQIPAPRLALAAESGIEAAVDRLLVRDGASPEFFGRIRRLAATLPPEAVRAALALNYKIRVTGYVTEGRPDLDLADDHGGGLHDWGEMGNFVIVAEHVLVPVVGPDGRPRPVGEWRDSVYWENALVHEMGHVLDAAFRLSDDRAFVSAWEADYAAMPAEMKAPELSGSRVNKFYYFVRRGRDGSFDAARDETCAEAFDVLLRRERSDYNYSNFTAYLPRTLAALRALLRERAGITVPDVNL